MQSMQLRAFGTALPLRAGACRAARPVQAVLVRASAQHKQQQQQSHGVTDSGRQQTQLPPSASAGATTAVLAMAGLLGPLLLDTDSALAVPSLLTGRSFALIHPAVMFFLFGSSLWAAYLGFQWRHTRELATTIKDKKALLPPLDTEGKRPASPLDAEIAALEAERKALIGKKLNEQHTNWGSLLLGLGITISVSGGYNTFLRTGKLFPGPHLYAGAAITVLWALAAALVPQMQKGNETARSAHIALNCINLALFAWQVPTGLDIVYKVFEFTSWP